MDLPIRRRHGVLWMSTAIIGLTVFLGVCGLSAAGEEKDARSGSQTDRQPHRLTAHLYFADRTCRFLTAEERILVHPGTPGGHGKEIVQGLIDGPGSGLIRALPPETELRALFVSKDGTAYVDLNRELKTAHSGGIQMERLSIYAIVNSLILNVPEIQAVKLLIDGKESLTLAGHMDLRFPFKADMLLIR